MALRRTLPSRQTTEASAAPGAAPAWAPPQPTPAPQAVAQSEPVSPAPTQVTVSAADFAAFDQPIVGQSLQPQSPAAPAPEAVTQPPVPAQQESQAQPGPVAEPSTPTAESETLTPSRPAADMPRRKVRTKEPRAFQQPLPEEPEMPPSPVPQATDIPIHQVDDRLAQVGLVQAPPADALTQGLPSAVPVMSQETPSLPEPLNISTREPSQGGAVPSTPAPLPAPMTEANAIPPQDAFLTASVTTPTSAPESDLPWANPAATAESGWSIDVATPTAEGSSTPAPAAPPSDVFHPSALTGSMALYGSNAMGQSSAYRAPEIVTASTRSTGPTTTPGSRWQVMLAAGVVAAAIGGAYYFVSGRPAEEAMAQLTPAAPAAQPAPSQTVGLLPPPVAPSTVAQGPGAGMPVTGSTVVAFTDVPPAEAQQPIVATGVEAMPEDVGYIANLQRAIQAEKEKKGQGTGTPQLPETAVPTTTSEKIAKLEEGADLKAQLQADLAAYRQALANTPKPLAPKPMEFLKSEQKSYMDTNTVGTSAPAAPVPATDAEGAPVPTDQALLPPPNQPGADNAGLLPPPNQLYANNPANLPIVGQPTSAEAPRVRQLSDFNVAMFEPDQEKVRIPQGVKPKLSSSSFPSLEVLSFVPGKGLIAYKDGKEGVLMLGEEIEGWQLMAVSTDVAEFRNGRRTQYVSAAD